MSRARANDERKGPNAQGDARKLGTLLAQPQILAPRPIRANSWACETLESCDAETGELNSTMIWTVLVDMSEALMEGRFFSDELTP